MRVGEDKAGKRTPAAAPMTWCSINDALVIFGIEACGEACRNERVALVSAAACEGTESGTNE